ncbi:hypothetical protein ON010_g15036 [Phytophthora cinnamomi]|nr:hypothetical protein ON010_g15036 [Phytophthora cinnamomi]
MNPRATPCCSVGDSVRSIVAIAASPMTVDSRWRASHSGSDRWGQSARATCVAGVLELSMGTSVLMWFSAPRSYTSYERQALTRRATCMRKHEENGVAPRVGDVLEDERVVAHDGVAARGLLQHLEPDGDARTHANAGFEYLDNVLAVGILFGTLVDDVLGWTRTDSDFLVAKPEDISTFEERSLCTLADRFQLSSQADALILKIEERSINKRKATPPRMQSCSILKLARRNDSYENYLCGTLPSKWLPRCNAAGEGLLFHNLASDSPYDSNINALALSRTNFFEEYRCAASRLSGQLDAGDQPQDDETHLAVLKGECVELDAASAELLGDRGVSKNSL